VLTEFQLEVAQLFFTLPASKGFLLAGGAALIAQQLSTRPTQDLDFFTGPDRGNVTRARDEFEQAADTRGWRIDRIHDGTTFCRLLIHGPEQLLVDMVLDSAPGLPATASVAGPTYAPEELAGRKLIARPRRSPRLLRHLRTLGHLRQTNTADAGSRDRRRVRPADTRHDVRHPPAIPRPRDPYRRRRDTPTSCLLRRLGTTTPTLTTKPENAPRICDGGSLYADGRATLGHQMAPSAAWTGYTGMYGRYSPISAAADIDIQPAPADPVTRGRVPRRNPGEPQRTRPRRTRGHPHGAPQRAAHAVADRVASPA
jgi:hypothetical protein